MLQRSRNNKWVSSLGAQRCPQTPSPLRFDPNGSLTTTSVAVIRRLSTATMPLVCVSGTCCFDSASLMFILASARSAIAPVIWRRRAVIVFIGLLTMLPAALWTLRNTTFNRLSASHSPFLFCCCDCCQLSYKIQPVVSASLSSSIIQGNFAKLAEAQEVRVSALLSLSST